MGRFPGRIRGRRTTQEEYKLATHRRSSIDLMHMSATGIDFNDSNSKMDMGGADTNSQFMTFNTSSSMNTTADLGTDGDLIVDFDNGKRKRFRNPRVASIHEGCEDVSSDDGMDDDTKNDESEIEYDTATAPAPTTGAEVC